MKLKKYLDKYYTKKEQNNLTYLDCSSEGITSLDGIEQLVNLEMLYCPYNKLTSFSCASLKGIENLTNLKHLRCHNNPLTYYNLNNLKDLKDLKLEVKKEIRHDKIQKLLKSVL